MQINKPRLSQDVLEEINFYRNKNIQEIKKIKPQWACGTNKNRLHDKGLSSAEGYKLYYVELAKLIEIADFGEMMYEKLNPQELFTGVDERDFRVAKALNHWSKNGYMDPPDICLNHLGEISFGDGRHRTLTAYHLGEGYIPVMVHQSLVKRISAIINISKVKI